MKLRLSKDDHLYRKKLLAMWSCLIGLAYYAFTIASQVMRDLYPDDIDGTRSAVTGMVSVFAACVWAWIDIGLDKRLSKRPRTRNIIYQVLLLVNVVALIAGLTQITSSTFMNDGYSALEGTLATLDSFALVLNAVFCVVFCQLSWWPAPRAGRSVLLICGVIEFLIGTLMIIINYGDLNVNEHNKRLSHLYQHSGSVIIAVAIMGICICMILREGDRLNKLLSRLLQFFWLLTGISMVLNLVYFGFSLRTAVVVDYGDELQWVFYRANPVLAAAALASQAAHIIASTKLQKKPPSNLRTEVIDLWSLSETQCNAFADLIDQHGKQYSGAPSGKEAISLMKSYVATNGSVDGMNCKVLRVYKPDDIPKNLDHQQWPFSKRPIPSSYDEVAAWRDLDKEAVLPQFTPHPEVVTETIGQPQQQQQQPLSKNQLKRLAKKNAKKNKQVDLPIQEIKTEEQLKDELEFKAKIMATEALVLLTRIDSYDLTSTVTGKFGRLLAKTLGAESFFKPLVVPMGILAFHWPFRQSTFYCSHTRRPVARSAAILRAITEWNESLPSDERCTIMMDPRYEQDISERAIVPSGWHKIPLPSSHIVDLRPYKGKSLQDYLKAIKYRNQSTAFNKANGQIVECGPNPDASRDVIELWSKIAEKRTGDGHTAVLATPTVEMINRVTHASDNYRTLLFLKVNDQPIASCVLFRLGDTITSDLQGLNHEEARKYKAYFVMMQHTIEIALKEGISFVDFGPTTSKPKLDIGCQSVPLVGAMKATSLPLNLAIRTTAKKINV